VISDLISNFPKGYTPNKQQVKLLKTIDEAFKSDHKFVICNAPTGSGKSFISKTLGESSESCPSEFRDLVTSYLAYKHNHGGGFTYDEECSESESFGCTALTITKSLQDQYKELFNDVEVLKGKSNYQCTLDDSFAVDVAPCVHLNGLKEECWKKDSCSYYSQRNKTLTSKFNTLNYNMFFSLPNHVKKRQIIICDEASELEDQLVKEFTCKVEYSFLRKCGITIRPFISTKSHERWISSLLIEVSDCIKDVKDEISTKQKSPPNMVIPLKIKLAQLINLQKKLELVLDTWTESEYVHEKDNLGVVFMPLKVDKLSHRLFDFADKVILMSATIINPTNFCKTLGITDYKYVEAESSFDPKNAPIICNTKYKLSYHTLNKYLPRIVKQVEALCEHHRDEKGIIHTHNNVITRELANVLGGDRFLFREPGIRNEEILEQHTATDKPTVLVSPSMSYGVDLKGDLARFQIIMKAPFLPTKDVRIERMMKDNFDWYMDKMLCSLIQSCGRGIRSKDDKCVTYILDGNIAQNVVKNKHKLPNYFVDRFL